ncbi:FAD-dependent monooxygenase [Winogradskyella litorisediminis]|uniref:FAD-dependent monooxygenase n=1 Tax=Winogradskyella litorisediminis TaxID=1156618 RepID=A0ABW3N6K2_9FLAO
METSEQKKLYKIPCPKCKGQGIVAQRKKASKQKTKSQKICNSCNGSGLINSLETVPINYKLPKVAIIGGGIGGMALAAACYHRGIPFTLYERDSHFKERSQGYGLTLQQASKALKGFGINHLKEGITSTKHIVYKTDGTVIGEWGMRKWLKNEGVIEDEVVNENQIKNRSKKTNIHIARQALRLELLNQIKSTDLVKWNHRFVSYSETENGQQCIKFEVEGNIITKNHDLIVGADGIRSTLRKQLLGNNYKPLRYLDCVVILGICPLSNLKGVKSDLLDLKTVFQTANGNERMYMMPFSEDSIMWQFSFKMNEEEAIILSKEGSEALKFETYKRTQWHSPIPEIIDATPEKNISGYPVYDRTTLNPEDFIDKNAVTLIGDAAHPMSPFKGQGANQAMLDALDLAKLITKHQNWQEKGIRKTVLNLFEKSMLKRSAKKVKASAEAAKLLHSEIILKEKNAPRGR